MSTINVAHVFRISWLYPAFISQLANCRCQAWPPTGIHIFCRPQYYLRLSLTLWIRRIIPCIRLSKKYHNAKPDIVFMSFTCNRIYFRFNTQRRPSLILCVNSNWCWHRTNWFFIHLILQLNQQFYGFFLPITIFLLASHKR